MMACFASTRICRLSEFLNLRPENVRNSTRLPADDEGRRQGAARAPAPVARSGRVPVSLSRSVVQRRLARLGRRVGVRLHPHLLRSTAATHMAEKGIELSVIQDILDHHHEAVPRGLGRAEAVRDRRPRLNKGEAPGHRSTRGLRMRAMGYPLTAAPPATASPGSLAQVRLDAGGVGLVRHVAARRWFLVMESVVDEAADYDEDDDANDPRNKGADDLDKRLVPPSMTLRPCERGPRPRGGRGLRRLQSSTRRPFPAGGRPGLRSG
jgi:hypothetical protein